MNLKNYRPQITQIYADFHARVMIILLPNMLSMANKFRFTTSFLILRNLCNLRIPNFG